MWFCIICIFEGQSLTIKKVLMNSVIVEVYNIQGRALNQIYV